MSAWRSRYTFKRNQRLGAKLVVLTLALVIFARLEPKLNQSAPTVSRRGSTNNFGVITASAAYLDSIGQLTNVMNEFVNSLLEKVSFLAEIIIESSLEEECPAPFVANQAAASGESQTPGTGGATNSRFSSSVDQTVAASRIKGTTGASMRLLINASACRQYEQRHNLTSSAASHRLSRDTFDENEFTNVDYFLSAYLRDAQATLRKPPADNLTVAQPPRGFGCKLFTFDLSPEDLPADDMGLCCYQFHACYSTCGRTKLECDQQFRACLTGICKVNFNYKNETLVRAFEAKLARAQQAPFERNLNKRDVDVLDERLDGEDDDDQDLGYEPSASANAMADDYDDNELDVEESSRVGVRAVRQAGAAAADEPQPTAGASKSDGQSETEAGERGGGGEKEVNGQAATGEELDARAIKRMRDKYKACKLASKLLIIGNLAFGCQNYRQAQWRTCCVSS